MKQTTDGMIKYGVVAEGVTNPESRGAPLEQCAKERIVKEAQQKTQRRKDGAKHATDIRRHSLQR